MRSIEDPTFGLVRWRDGVWITQKKWKFCGKQLKVEVEKDAWSEDPPDEKQREAFNEFIRALPEVQSQFEAALLKQYESKRPELIAENETDFMKAWAVNYPEMIKSYPPIDSLPGIWKFAKLAGIHVGDQIVDHGVAILYRWTWDVEHQYELWFEKGQLVGEERC